MTESYLEIKNVDFQVGGNVKIENMSLSIEKAGEIIC